MSNGIIGKLANKLKKGKSKGNVKVEENAIIKNVKSETLKKKTKRAVAALMAAGIITTGATLVGCTSADYTDNADSTKLEQVDNESVDYGAELEALRDALADYNEQIEELKQQIQDLDDGNNKYQEKIEELEKEVTDLKAELNEQGATNEATQARIEYMEAVIACMDRLLNQEISSEEYVQLINNLNMVKLELAITETFSTQCTKMMAYCDMLSGTLSPSGSPMYSGSYVAESYTTIDGSYATRNNETGAYSYIYHDGAENITFGKGSDLNIGNSNGDKNANYVKKEDTNTIASSLISGFCAEGYTATEDDGVYSIVTNEGNDFGTVTIKNGVVTSLVQYSHSNDYTDTQYTIEKITQEEAEQSMEKIQGDCQAYQDYSLLQKGCENLAEQENGEMHLKAMSWENGEPYSGVLVCNENKDSIQLYVQGSDPYVDYGTSNIHGMYIQKDGKATSYSEDAGVTEKDQEGYGNYGYYASSIVNMYTTSDEPVQISSTTYQDGTTSITLLGVHNDDIDARDCPTKVAINKDGEIVEMSFGEGMTDIVPAVYFTSLSKELCNDKIDELCKIAYAVIDDKEAELTR